MHNHTTNTNKPSTVEHLKGKAAHLVEKVTGKPHGHHGTTTHTEPLDHNNTLDPTKGHHTGPSNTLDHTKGHHTEPLGHNNTLDHSKGRPTEPLGHNTSGRPTEPLGHNNTL
ncbi:hypothetical protein BGZ50_001923, partial [Haplosporangium sp. Z 11]